MPKQLNVNLAFTADTGAAKRQLQDLQNQLTKLSQLQTTKTEFGLTKEIKEASAGVAQLKVALEAATNVNTGKLDLSRFSDQLNKSGLKLKDYQKMLSALGPEGDKAFASLASSIQAADVQLKRSNTLVTELWTTLKNTARWQLSSSMLHGFMGAVSAAYGYAQDLNESLNNIRIVTGQDTEQMAKFADQANKAAKSLSTTTTKYTDAALIYYQQGLNDDEVIKRTDVTVKMANVARESATEVSSYMTAIWNNFNKEGDYSEEHFADVMTKLGATTAASTAEIANGLEKFASVSSTIGLSFDYASAALATIVDKTRQSEDVVGTALKTIFARIQGLKLGETLEDGTELNKYSKALQSVGISIFDQMGQLKDMDSILDELGAKWQTISKDQQVALAQTVAGTRQYNQLVALMDNWDAMQKNVMTAREADGTLQEQADIYAESWEAASKRVRASAEAIYSSLIDDKFFISLNNGFSKFLDAINNTIKGLGGLKGVLFTIGTLITSVFSKQISTSIENMVNNIVMSTNVGRERVLKLREEANKLLINNAANDGSIGGMARSSAYKAQGDAQAALLTNSKYMSEANKEIAKQLLDQNKALGDQVIKQGEVVDNVEKEIRSRKHSLEVMAAINGQTTRNGNLKSPVQKKLNETSTNMRHFGALSSIQDAFDDVASKTGNFKENVPFEELQAKMKAYEEGLKQISQQEDIADAAIQELGEKGGEAFLNLKKAIENPKKSTEDLNEAWKTFSAATTSSLKGLEKNIDSLAAGIAGVSEGAKFEEAKKALTEYLEKQKQYGAETMNSATKTGTLAQHLEFLKKKFEELNKSQISVTQALTQLGSILMQVGMLVNSIDGLLKVWNDDQADTKTKLMTTLTTLGMFIPTLTALGTSLTSLTAKVTLFGGAVKIAFGWVAVAVAALTALAVIVYKVFKHFDKQDQFDKSIKKTEEATEKWKEFKTELESVENELESLQNKLKELEDIKTPSLADQQEIDRLKTEINLLESKKRILADQEKKAKDDAIINYNEARDKLVPLKNNTKLNRSDFGNNLWGDRYGASSSTLFGGKAIKDIELNDIDSRNKYAEALENYKIENGKDDIFYKEGLKHLQKWDEKRQEWLDNINALGEQAAELLPYLSSDKTSEDYQNALSDYSTMQVANGTASKSASQALAKGNFSNDELQKIAEAAQDGILESGEFDDPELFEKIKAAAEDALLTIEDFGANLVDVESQIEEIEQQRDLSALQAAQTLDELTQAWNNILENTKDGDTTNYDAYSEALIRVASEYKECSNEIKNYQDALNSGDITLVEEAEQVLKASMYLEDSAKKYSLDLDTLKTQAALLKSNAKDLNLTTEQAARLAVQNQRMNKGVSDLVKNWKDWNKVLNSADKTTEDYAKTVRDVNKCINNLVGAADDLELSEEFISAEQTMSLLERATNGEEKAIDLLGASVSKEMAKAQFETEAWKATLNDTFKDGLDLDSTADEFARLQNVQADVLAGFDALFAGIEDGSIQAGQTLEEASAAMGASWIDSLNEMAVATGMSAAEMRSMLESAGVEAEVVSEIKTVHQRVPRYVTKTSIKSNDPVTGEKEVYTSTYQDGFDEVDGEMEVAQINMGDAAKGTRPKFAGNSKISSSATSSGSKSGGGGSKKTAKTAKDSKLTSQSDMVDRYKEITDAIEDVKKEYDKANKSADRLFGKDKLKAIDQQNKLLLKQKDLVAQKEKEALQYLELDKKELNDYAKKLGKEFVYDADGDITNYTKVMTELFNKYSEAEKKYYEFKDADAQSNFKENTLDPIKDEIDRLKELIKQYEDTKNIAEDLKEEQEELHRQWQDHNYEKITYEVELKTTITQNKIAEIDSAMRVLGDTVYVAAEAFGLLNSKLEIAKPGYETYKVEMDQLTTAYQKGEISQSAYIEGLQQVHDGALDTADAIMDLDEAMLAYYGETLDKIDNEISRYTDHLEHLTEILQHYQKIFELTGKSVDYKKMGIIYQGIADTRKNSYDISKRAFEEYQKQIEQEEQFLNKAGMTVEELLSYTGNDSTIQAWKDRWFTLQQHADEAESQMQSDAESFIEALNDVLVNGLDSIAYEMEQTMTNGMGFDSLLDSMNRVTTYQDEFLTKTNQIYEMNKLQRKVSQDIDKTDNAVAKRRYLAFNDELEQLKQKDELSQLELEIAEAKYKQLQAQMALEEAQNAKSTVRLSRDSEGNYGYVYTADKNAVDDAMQAVEDANNDLYNIGLKASYNYSNKMAQLRKETIEKLAELDKRAKEDELYRETQYQADRERVIEQATQLYLAYSNLYAAGTEVDSRIVADSWATSYNDIVNDTNTWYQAIDYSVTEVKQLWEGWKDEIQNVVTPIVGENLKDLKNKTSEVRRESQDLANITTSMVVPALFREATAVQDLTAKYLYQRREVQALIQELQRLATFTGQEIEATAGVTKSNGSTNYALDYLLGDNSAAQKRIDKMGGSSADTELLVNHKQEIIDFSKEKHNGEIVSNAFEEWKRANPEVTFSTGGYTGEWGDSGKLAVLHEKELILNKDDTQNFLDSLQLTRRIIEMIDINALNSQFSQLNIPNVFGNKDVLEQIVTIQAEFPSVTDRNEIEEAFNTLINRASQYAGR